MDISVPLVLLIASVSAGAVTLGLLAMHLYGSLRPVVVPRTSLFAMQDAAPIFVFDGQTLLDASPAARRLIGQAIGDGRTWQDGRAWEGVMGFLAARFPDLAAQIDGLGSTGQITLTSTRNEVNPLVLHASRNGGLLRLTLSDADSEAARGHDPLTDRTIAEELDRLRQLGALIPYPVWREDAGGRVTWANQSYLTGLCETRDDGIGWPLPRLFPAMPPGDTRHRAQLEKGAVTQWFDISAHPDGSGETLFFATPADAAVSAEKALREFMQTLARTFAHLPIGLAVFDRQRQLAMFNPALADLTDLKADFLTMKPTLYALLDQMRERRTIPEPKDYRSWRKQMAEIEKAATAGQFQETWNLPGGRTYRVSGRPHPNGAMALIIEDITTEMSRARLFRANLEMAQSVLDTLADGIAVFSESGVLVMSNRAYADLWDHDPSDALGAGAIGSMSAHWQARSAPTETWSRIEGSVLGREAPGEWSADVRLTDGRIVSCHVRPLGAGATMVSFRLPEPADPAAVAVARDRRRQRA